MYRLLRQVIGAFSMRALINRTIPCTERRIWFTFGLFKRSLGHGPVRKTKLLYNLIGFFQLAEGKVVSPESSP